MSELKPGDRVRPVPFPYEHMHRFSALVKQWRKERSWTQAQAASACGYSTQYYALIENGINMSIETARKVLNGYGKSLADVTEAE